jgi:glutathione S-transferase
MSHNRIEIYGIPQSNFTRAVRMVCEEKAIDYDHLPVRPHSDEANAIHPLGKIPGLRYGQVRLGESRAIVAYLDRLYPETPMMPTGPGAPAAEAEQWFSIVMTAMDPVWIRQYVFANLFPQTSDGTVDRAVVDAALPTLKAQIELLDGALAGKDFLAAARFTFADALLLSSLAAVQLFPEGAQAIDAAPNLARYLNLHSSRASFIATDPWRTADAGATA